MHDFELEEPIQIESAKKKKAQELENLAVCYARTFSTKEGQKVLADLFNRFVVFNDTNLASPNIQYEAAYHDGESGVVKYINSMIGRTQRAKEED